MWIKKEPKLKRTDMFDYEGSPAIVHSVMCWLCDTNSAIYFAYPYFIFIPCNVCQKRYEGWWTMWNKSFFWRLSKVVGVSSFVKRLRKTLQKV